MKIQIVSGRVRHDVSLRVHDKPFVVYSSFCIVEPNAKLRSWGSEYHYHVRFDGLGRPAVMTYEPEEENDDGS